MERKLVLTEDGSHTIYIPELGEHYHSIHGAVKESQVIFIDAAFLYCDKNPVRILEFGMGTGLNVLLSFLWAKKMKREVYYHSIEKYPITSFEKENLNLVQSIGLKNPDVFNRIHDSSWMEDHSLSTSFTFFKEKCDFREAKLRGKYDVIYFDAFAPEVQPELWSYNMFEMLGEASETGAVLTTYSVKGQVKRKLKSAGFKVEKLSGPPGKR